MPQCCFILYFYIQSISQPLVETPVPVCAAWWKVYIKTATLKTLRFFFQHKLNKWSASVSCSWLCSSSVRQVTGRSSVTSVGFHSLKRATYWGTSNSTRERSPSNARSAATLAAAVTPWPDICAHTQVRLSQLYAIAIRRHMYGQYCGVNVCRSLENDCGSVTCSGKRDVYRANTAARPPRKCCCVACKSCASPKEMLSVNQRKVLLWWSITV